MAVSGLTHVYYSFALFRPNDGNDYNSWNIYFMDDGTNDVNSLIEEFISLKQNNPQLSCYLSIGGWDFSDPGSTQSYWSDMVSTQRSRQAFAKALLQTLQQYGFDGVDLDWEYPKASDRGGDKADTENYISLISQLRETFDASGESYGISFTIPTSYWYMQNFDIPNMLQGGADWANLMGYDLHGVWDGHDP